MLDYTRILSPPRQSFFLLGPRGTGKSTWLRNHFKKARWIDLLDQRLFLRYTQDPGLLFQELVTLDRNSWIVIDEFQRVPELLNEVHRLIEEKKLRFALTGSSARKLRRSGVNLLGGRALHKEMFPLLASEMGDDFVLDKALRFGTIPLICASKTPEDQLESYVALYFKEEIQAEALVRNLAPFSRFLPIAAVFHGQAINVSNISRDAGVKRPTAQGFMEIIKDTLIGRMLPAYETKLRVRESKHSKFYLIDPGVVRALKGARGPVLSEERGPLLEGLVYFHLLAHQSYSRAFDSIHYWAPAEAIKTEIDFLVSSGKEIFAIEVKATSRLRPEHFVGLRAIHGLKGLKKKILVYEGKERRQLDDIEILPVEDFLKNLPNI